MPDTDTPLTLATLGTSLIPYLKGAPALYLTGEESLRIRSFNSAAGVYLAVEGRVLQLTGQLEAMSSPHVPNTDRTPATTVIALGPGWLSHVSVRATQGAPRRGQCFVVVELVRGRDNAMQPLGVVLQGYVKELTGLAWPGSPIIDSPEGPGVIRSITGTNPGAGAEVLETVPANARWRVLSVAIQFQASAAAANRETVLLLDDGATTYAAIPTGRTVTANQGPLITFARGVDRFAFATAVPIAAPFPLVEMMGGHRLQTSTANLQAGDDYGAPQLLVEEWIED